MSTLTLVRHAQASFLSDNYDELSPLGEEQAERLGEFWAMQEVRFDRAYTGPGRRHRDTAQTIARVFARRGQPFPEVHLLHDLDEFNIDTVLYSKPETVVDMHPGLAPAYEQLIAAQDDVQARRRAFQHFFEGVAALWVEGKLEVPGVEDWSDFARRVRRAIAAMTSGSPSGHRVVAFTSGGPIAVAVQHALHLTPHHTLQLVWALRNASLTEFLYTKDRYSLSIFNGAPHFRDTRMLTYR